MRPRYWRFTVVLLISILVAAPALAKPAESITEGAQIESAYPGARVFHPQAGRWSIHGPMTSGPTPESAASLWLDRHASFFGKDANDLRRADRNDVGSGFAVMRYRQFVDGLPVEDGLVRMLVRKGDSSRVIYVGARLAAVPKAGLGPLRIGGAEAVGLVRRLPSYAHLTEWSEPQLVVIAAEHNRMKATRAWRFNGRLKSAEIPDAYTFFVDGADGSVIEARKAIIDATIHGHVSGHATRGLQPPDLAELDERDLPNLQVQIEGVASTYAEKTGNFSLEFQSGGDPLVRARLIGPWVHAVAYGGDDLLEETLAEPGSFLSFAFAKEGPISATAQVNGYVQGEEAHEFYTSREPDFGGLDILLPITVNLEANWFCNAYYDVIYQGIYLGNGASEVVVNLPEGGSALVDCSNASYRGGFTLHEYGHFLHQQLGIPHAGDAFDEGLGDTFQVLVNDDPVIGRDMMFLYVNGERRSIRDIEHANQQFPCAASDPHICGQVLAGVWWDIRTGLVGSEGQEDGLEMARQLFTDWSQITAGPDHSQAAGSETALEVLAMDDDDGEICNGTPHTDEICTAFEQHNIGCPLRDCDDTGIPDLCDLYPIPGPPPPPDCNENHIPDACDIGSGRSRDLNNNGVPDECDPPPPHCDPGEICP